MNLQYDTIVIGSGQGGTPLSLTLANSGLRTVLVERKHVGGTCINEGCTPTKTMVASGRVAYLARRAADYGIHTGPITVDLKKVRQRKRDIVDSFRNSNQSGVGKTTNVDLISGHARFTAAKTIQVRLHNGGERTMSAERFFINAGTRAGIPKLDGLDSAPFLDNISIMELGDLPEQLIVLGGGYIGLEFGQLFRRLGSRVSIVHSGRQLLNHEDSDITEEITKILRQDG